MQTPVIHTGALLEEQSTYSHLITFYSHAVILFHFLSQNKCDAHCLNIKQLNKINAVAYKQKRRGNLTCASVAVSKIKLPRTRVTDFMVRRREK